MSSFLATPRLPVTEGKTRVAMAVRGLSAQAALHFHATATLRTMHGSSTRLDLGAWIEVLGRDVTDTFSWIWPLATSLQTITVELPDGTTGEVYMDIEVGERWPCAEFEDIPSLWGALLIDDVRLE